MSVQPLNEFATLRDMNDRYGRANLQQIRMLVEEMEAQIDRDGPRVPVERATEADQDERSPNVQQACPDGDS